MEVFFPSVSDLSGIREYYNNLKRRTLLVIQSIKGSDVQAEIEKIDEHFFSLVTPQRWDGREGVEVQHIKAFEETCTILNQYIPKDPKKMTTLEFYSNLEVIRAQLKEQQKRSEKAARR